MYVNESLKKCARPLQSHTKLFTALALKLILHKCNAKYITFCVPFLNRQKKKKLTTTALAKKKFHSE